jgi:hypothetical protein
MIEKYVESLISLGMPESFIKLAVNAFTAGYDASTLIHKGELEDQETTDEYVVH